MFLVYLSFPTKHPILDFGPFGLTAWIAWTFAIFFLFWETASFQGCLANANDCTVHLLSRPCHLVGFTLNLPPSTQLKTSLASVAGKLPVGTSMLPLTWTLCLLHLQKVYWTPGRSVPYPVYYLPSYFGDMKFSHLRHLHRIL